MTPAKRYVLAMKIQPVHEAIMCEAEAPDLADDTELKYVLATDFDRLLGENERLKAEHDQAWINHEEIWQAKFREWEDERATLTADLQVADAIIAKLVEAPITEADIQRAKAWLATQAQAPTGPQEEEGKQ